MKNKFALIGNNISYSLSPYIFEYLAKKAKINTTYEIISTSDLNTVDFSALAGFNLTTPYKSVYLSKLSNIDDYGHKYGSINTVFEDKGYNTDIHGFCYLLKRLNVKKIKRTVIIGSGAMSQMIQTFFEDQEVEVIITSRKKAVNPDLLYGDLLINTTPCGQGELRDVFPPIPEQVISNFNYVIDLNYNPGVSPLLVAAKKRGISNINGLYMLIYQVILNFNIFFGTNFDETIIEEIKEYLNPIRYHGKLCLIGPPFAGKSTRISKYSDSIDLDQYITLKEGMAPCDIINTKGLKFFRDLEHKYLKEIVNKYDSIALGGGTVLNFDNLLLLRDYQMILIDPGIETLLTRMDDNTRPLIKNKADLEKIYYERKDIYNEWINQ